MIQRAGREAMKIIMKLETGSVRSCQQTVEEDNENLSIRGRQLRDPELKLIVDYLENGKMRKRQGS